MPNAWHELPITTNNFKTVNAVVEIGKRTKAKIELCKNTGMFKVDRILQGSLVFPVNYGFFPQSISEDGDPLDVMILGQDSLPTGTYLECRAIGVIKMTDDGKSDDKIIAVHIGDPAVKMYNEISDLKGYIIPELERFLSDYKKYEDKIVILGGLGDATTAKDIIQKAFLAYDRMINEEY